MNSKNECVVVGASAVGSAAAYYLSKNGIDTLLAEEHKIAGKFHKCSGLFSKSGLEGLGLNYKSSILNSIRGARFIFPGDEFTVSSSIIQAYVTDRQKLDESFCQQAIEAGAKVVFNKRFEKGIEKNGKILSYFSDNLISQSDYLVGCDGINSSVATNFEFPKINQATIVIAYEAEIENCTLYETDKVQVFLNQLKYPGFFAWIIPISSTRARFGVATDNLPFLNVAKRNLFSEKETIKIIGTKKIKLVREFYHTIPLSLRKITQKSNVILAGDSAGQTKSTTGGGVIFGCQCARIAADSINLSIQKRIPLNYEYAWRNRVGNTLYAHRKIREIYNMFDNFGLNTLAKTFKLFGGPQFLSRFGHMDNILV